MGGEQYWGSLRLLEYQATTNDARPGIELLAYILHRPWVIALPPELIRLHTVVVREKHVVGTASLPWYPIAGSGALRCGDRPTTVTSAEAAPPPEVGLASLNDVRS